MAIYECSILRSIFSLAFFVTMIMASTSINDYFPSVKGNLTKITWAHAVNNKSYLTDVLSDENIMMIEADVVLDLQDNPIMAHPPDNTSDLSLSQFLVDVKTFNKKTTTTKKGVKLDFKSTEAFVASKVPINEIFMGTNLLWINADIIPGPIDAQTVPVDADTFLNEIKDFPNATISIGWTTEYGSDVSGAYTAAQIQTMTDAITKNNVTQDITFPVRAGLAAESIDLLEGLLKNVDNSTFTIWSSEGDNVNVDHLRSLIAKVTVSKVYVDVPSDLLGKLRLDNLPNSGSKTIVNIVGIVMTVLLIFRNYF